MIKYRYSLIKDIKNAIWILGDRKWFKNHDVVVFWPNPLRWIWLLFWIIFSKKPVIKADRDIVCYLVSSGTWGAYHPEEYAISICPWKINQSIDKGIEGVIRHEILHLEHPEGDEMDHAEKEAYVDNFSF